MSSEAVRLGRDFWVFRILAGLRGQKIGWEFDRPQEICVNASKLKVSGDRVVVQFDQH